MRVINIKESLKRIKDERAEIYLSRLGVFSKMELETFITDNLPADRIIYRIPIDELYKKAIRTEGTKELQDILLNPDFKKLSKDKIFKIIGLSNKYRPFQPHEILMLISG